MPTWPSGTKASTTNVDAGTDQISQARADIKQNIDNVNDIIDTFNIASPTDGQVMQYSSSSGLWEPVNASVIGGGSKRTIFYPASGTYTNTTGASGGFKTLPMTLEADGGAINNFDAPILYDSAGNFDTPEVDSAGGSGSVITIGAGYFQFLLLGDWPVDAGGPTIRWYVTPLDDQNNRIIVYNNDGNSDTENGNAYFYNASSRQYIIEYNSTAGIGDQIFTGGQSVNWRLIVYKHS